MVGRTYTTFYFPLLKSTCVLLKIEVYNAGSLNSERDPLCITASWNILASENISLQLFMAFLGGGGLSTFSYLLAEYHFAQL